MHLPKRAATVMVCGLLLLIASVTAAQDDTPALTLEHDDLARTYYLTVPESYDEDEPTSLVLTLHGAGGTGLQMKEALGFDELAEESGYIIAYPDGIDFIWDYLDIPVNRNQVVDDLGFLTALIDELESEYNISDVYVMGWSNGGLLALRMRCALADRLSGVAVVGSNMTFRLAEACVGAAPVSLMQVIGTADQSFPWEGSMEVTPEGALYSSLSIIQTVGFVISQGQCESTFADEVVSPLDAPVTVQFWGYNDCINDTEYRLYAVIELDHQWPNGLIFGSISGGNRPTDVQQLVFEFFDADFSQNIEE